jgi:thiosulfate dehydrogenase (quinone) large subunit
MTTATTDRAAGAETAQPIAAAPAVPESSTATRVSLGLTRIALGFVMFWAFLDKAFGLGFATERADAWINGGSPTFGFLTFGTSGPFAETYQSIAGAAWADWLFMVGLFGIGLALILGIGLRVAAISGTVLMLMMWSASLLPENNPIITYHVIYALMMVTFAFAHAGRHLGLGGLWERTALVRRLPILR